MNCINNEKLKQKYNELIAQEKKLADLINYSKVPNKKLLEYIRLYNNICDKLTKCALLYDDMNDKPMTPKEILDGFK